LFTAQSLPGIVVVVVHSGSQLNEQQVQQQQPITASSTTIPLNQLVLVRLNELVQLMLIPVPVVADHTPTRSASSRPCGSINRLFLVHAALIIHRASQKLQILKHVG
jgi:hypothetical protein